MKQRAQQRIVRNRRAAVRKEPISWGYFLLTVLCASLMATGFFFVAVQHFVTMDLGFKNSEMRKQVQELEAEKRRLLLAKEVALSPVEVKRTAVKLGFKPFESVIAVSAPDKLATAGDLARSATVVRTVQGREVNGAVSQRPAEARTEKRSVKAAVDSRPRVVEDDNDNDEAKTIKVVATLR